MHEACGGKAHRLRYRMVFISAISSCAGRQEDVIVGHYSRSCYTDVSMPCRQLSCCQQRSCPAEVLLHELLVMIMLSSLQAILVGRRCLGLLICNAECVQNAYNPAWSILKTKIGIVPKSSVQIRCRNLQPSRKWRGVDRAVITIDRLSHADSCLSWFGTPDQKV